MVALLRDAARGVALTGRLVKASIRHPWGEESSDWRLWSLPWFLALFVFGPLVSAAEGYWSWLSAVALSMALAVGAVLLFAGLARRFEKDSPEA